MNNPIGHLSHKEFDDLTNTERVQVIAAYNDYNRYPDMRTDPGTSKLEHFWNSWNYDGESMPNNASELKVLRSAAGYYIGRTEEGMPYSRESTYFSTSEEAEELLNPNPNIKKL